MKLLLLLFSIVTSIQSWKCCQHSITGSDVDTDSSVNDADTADVYAFDIAGVLDLFGDNLLVLSDADFYAMLLLLQVPRTFLD